MSFDIKLAREAIWKGNVKIKELEGITHALMRVADADNASKNITALQEAFKKLNKKQRKDLMDLAKEVGNHAPFAWRTKNTKYNVTDRAKIDDILRLNPIAVPVPTSPKAPPVVPTPAPAPAASVPKPPSSAPAPDPVTSPQVVVSTPPSIDKQSKLAEALKKIDVYLITTEWYNKNPDGSYTKDVFTISIKDWKVQHTPFSSPQELREKEDRNVKEVAKHLSDIPQQ